MKMIVEGISQDADIALVRLWFLAPEIFARNVIYERTAQTKVVACFWSLVPDTQYCRVKIGPVSMAPSDDFRSVLGKSG